MAAIVGKIVENVKLSNLPSCHFALSWSQDERISVVTDQCVYVLTPTSSPQRSRTGVNVVKTCIHRQKQPLVLDVGVDREAMPTLKSFPCNLDPCANVYLSNCSGFQCAVWSPLNCDKNGRCIIATLSSDFQLCIHLSPFLGTKWKEVADVSQILWKYLKHKGFKIDLDVKLPDQFVSTHDEHFSDLNTSALNSAYAVLKQRTDMLSFTCLHWFSQLYHNNSNAWSSGVDDLSSRGTEKFAMLAAGCKRGHVVFWMVAVPVLRKITAAVDIAGFLDTKLSWPCCLAWQRTNDYQGLLAVGSTDGLVKVFSLEVLLGSSSLSVISGVAQYVLWGDRDELCAQLLEWLPEASDGALRLVVCKGPAVIVFTVSVKDGCIVQKPRHQLVRGVHSMPITGITCSQDQTVFTCSQDGCVQKISAADMVAKPVHFDGKHGFCYNGIAVSPNGVYLVLFQTPSYNTLQYLESHQVQILFINLFAGSSIGHLLNTEGTRLQRKWDLFKALQHFMYQRNELTPDLKALCSSDSLEAFSFENLVLRQHLLSLLASIAQQEFEPASKGAEQEIAHNWRTELARTADFMCKCLLSTTLESWLKGRWEGTVNNSDSASTLLMCDWLVKHFSDSFIVAMVSEVYKACNDSEGLRMLSARQHGNQTLDGVAGGSQQALLDTSANQVQAIATEARGEPMETSQSSPGHSESADESRARDISLYEVSPSATEIGVGESERRTKRNFTTSATDEGGLLADLPSREECPLCRAPIPLVDLNNGCCLNGHKWQRCSVTFTVCSDLTSKRCQDCNRCVSLARDGMSPWLRSLLERTSKCPLCWGWFNSSS